MSELDLINGAARLVSRFFETTPDKQRARDVIALVARLQARLPFKISSTRRMAAQTLELDLLHKSGSVH